LILHHRTECSKERGGRQLTPKVVQTLMGHSSIVMTLDLYGHLFPSSDDRAALAEDEKAALRPKKKETAN
jgi:integrase